MWKTERKIETLSSYQQLVYKKTFSNQNFNRSSVRLLLGSLVCLNRNLNQVWRSNAKVLHIHIYIYATYTAVGTDHYNYYWTLRRFRRGSEIFLCTLHILQRCLPFPRSPPLKTSTRVWKGQVGKSYSKSLSSSHLYVYGFHSSDAEEGGEAGEPRMCVCVGEGLKEALRLYLAYFIIGHWMVHRDTPGWLHPAPPPRPPSPSLPPLPKLSDVRQIWIGCSWNLVFYIFLREFKTFRVLRLSIICLQTLVLGLEGSCLSPDQIPISIQYTHRHTDAHPHTNNLIRMPVRPSQVSLMPLKRMGSLLQILLVISTRSKMFFILTISYDNVFSQA